LFIEAQSLSDYYPLQIGNKWFYKTSEYNVDTTPVISYYLKEVIGDTIMENGKKYFIIIEEGIRHYERFDMLTNEIRYYYPSYCEEYDAARYSLNYAKDSTIIWESCLLTYQINFVQSQTSDTSSICLDGYGLVSEKVAFRKYTGITARIFGEISYIASYLIGAKINGKEWGQFTSIKNDIIMDHNFRLEQNYPNPFNPATTIEYEIPQRGNVQIIIYDILGRRIKELLNEEKSTGKYSVTWNGKDNNGISVSSGTYFYQIISGNNIQTKKMVLLK